MVWRAVLRVVRVLGGAVLRRVVEVGDGVRREQRVKEREDVAGVLVGCGTAFGDAVCLCVCAVGECVAGGLCEEADTI